jgi:hypothetical protein
MNTLQTPAVLLDDTALASALSVSVSSIRKDRMGERRIPFLRVGKRMVRYDLARVLAVIGATEQGGPPQTRQRGSAKRGAL